MRYFQAVLVFCLLSVASNGQAKSVTDILGRQVEVPDNPQRIILGESRMLYTLALLTPGNPAERVIGWPADLERYDAQSWQLYTQKFPEIAQIPIIGNGNIRQINVERLIQSKPDLIILSRLSGGEGDDGTLARLTQAGIPVIYVDLRIDLLKHTVPSIKLLGEVLNHQARAEQFIIFYQRHMQVIQQRLAQYQGRKPKVMLHLHLGRRESCCTTASKGNLGDLIAFAGGDNIASSRINTLYGELNPENVLQANPDIYIATGMAGLTGKRFSSLQLGPLVNAEQAQNSFQQVLSDQPILSHLSAVTQGRAYSIWHNFYLSPYHVVAVEMFAKAFYPDLFADVCPQQTFQQLYQQFLPLPFSGIYWSQFKYGNN
ncbi:ABC transporter substrate-binding protein [Yersinia aleksiciae]|uniref:Periplasmic binding protein n=1 Tax=Yersinia aleksiciae TaxID=263819 RepID=A0ABM5UF84_YERAE|nr:ABC transporter substrate-binding protein [Yersinia aleksiciae]AKP34519.1 periplasmic binding protein [Yersinia aleksiciae]MDA5497631.1 ABC transporter substrate-binding protein [Yersinia aleksiciae]NIK98069.1 ABC transporter substrate-binding protein [Yersinia aleksiciae]WQC69916.1 ABC transporter substrate-binding protein [Yersinia aleksiciae]CFQ44243.1 ABC transporter periplasmic protein [Yersinia aleksiciae]